MKSVKQAFLFLLAAALVFSLCGCSALDAMHQQQALLQDENTVLWKGQPYKLLPSSDLLAPETKDQPVYLTQADVPVLLSFFIVEDYLLASTDETVLCGYQNYCREDVFDQVCQRLKEPFVPDVVLYEYWSYEEDAFCTYTLTQEQKDAIELVAQTVEPTALTQGLTVRYDWSVALEECSEDLLLRRGAGVTIAGVESMYYLILQTGTQDLVFPVPAGCTAIFDEMMAAFFGPEWEFEQDL